MIGKLSSGAIRVLGALIEKELSTPEYYPMTLNSLKNACNQKSNRNPVVSFSESDVIRALDELEKWRLVGHASGAGSRSVKYRHAIAQAMELKPAEIAVMACLFLRGAQTPGEIKGRTGRLFEFGSLEELEHTLDALYGREEPLVRSVPRRPGQKEDRFIHLVGELRGDEEGNTTDTEGLESPATAPGLADTDSDLHEQVMLLQDELARLREEFDVFKQQFE